MSNIFDSEVEKWLETAGNVKPSGPMQANKDKCKLAIDLIQEELDELKEAFETNDTQEAMDAIIDLKWVINNFIFYFGMDTEKLAEMESLVEVSNFSKFTTTEEDAQITVEHYANGTHPDKPGAVIEAYYKLADSKGQSDEALYIVLRKSDDKILKSHIYKSVTDLLSSEVDLNKETAVTQ